MKLAILKASYHKARNTYKCRQALAQQNGNTFGGCKLAGLSRGKIRLNKGPIKCVDLSYQMWIVLQVNHRVASSRALRMRSTHMRNTVIMDNAKFSDVCFIARNSVVVSSDKIDTLDSLDHILEMFYELLNNRHIAFQ
ncbi:hypothetical protein J6590_032842 [Homalodisca vitripennis]|nr:hypothetical protein J6590_032842 [Homalodisca vitripennis]